MTAWRRCALVTPGSQPGAVTNERLSRLRSVCLLGAPPADPAEQGGWRPALPIGLVRRSDPIWEGETHEEVSATATRRKEEELLMNYLRIYTGLDGHTHVADVEVPTVPRAESPPVASGDRADLRVSEEKLPTA